MKKLPSSLNVVPHGELLRDLSRRPGEIFRETLKLILGSLLNFFRHGGLTRAGSMAYATLLSLIPLLGLVVVLFKAFNGFDWLQRIMGPVLEEFLTTSGSESVSQVLFSILDNLNLKTLGLFGTVFLFIGAYSLITTIEKDFNGIWKVRRNRSILQRASRYAMLMSLLPVMAGVTIYLSGHASVSSLLDTLPTWMKEGSGHILPICVQFAVFWFLYWGLPNIRVRALPAAGGALFSAVAWEFAKYGFAFYAYRAGNYNLVYGSLAALPLLMIWIYLSWVITLVGAEMTFVIQNRHALLRMRDYRNSGHLPRYLIALAIMNEVAHAFREGKELDVDKLVQELDIPADELRPVIERLEDNNQLRRAEKEDHELLMPAKPLADLRLDQVLRDFIPDPAQLAGLMRSQRLGKVLATMESGYSQWMEVFSTRNFEQDLANECGTHHVRDEEGTPRTSA